MWKVGGGITNQSNLKLSVWQKTAKIRQLPGNGKDNTDLIVHRWVNKLCDAICDEMELFQSPLTVSIKPGVGSLVIYICLLLHSRSKKPASVTPIYLEPQAKDEVVGAMGAGAEQT